MNGGEISSQTSGKKLTPEHDASELTIRIVDNNDSNPEDNVD